MRRPLTLGVAAIALLAAVWTYRGPRNPLQLEPRAEPPAQQLSGVTTPAPEKVEIAEPQAAAERVVATPRVPAQSPPRGQRVDPLQLPSTRAEPTPLTRQLVGSLSQIDLSRGSITAERAAAWRESVQQLVQQGPAGAAAPSLIEMAEGASGGKLNALEMLAQMSAQHPEARAALIEQARANKISANMWPYLAPLLAGDLYHYQDSAFDSQVRAQGRRSNSAHVVLGNQHFYTAPTAEILTPEEIDQRMAFINELQAVTADPAALKTFERAIDMLGSRNPQTAAVSP